MKHLWKMRGLQLAFFETIDKPKADVLKMGLEKFWTAHSTLALNVGTKSDWESWFKYENATTQPLDEEKPKGSSVVVIIIIVLVAAAVIGAAVYFFVLKKKPSTDDDFKAAS